MDWYLLEKELDKSRMRGIFHYTAKYWRKYGYIKALRWSGNFYNLSEMEIKRYIKKYLKTEVKVTRL